MCPQYSTCPLNKQASEEQAERMAQQVEQFLHPLLVWLDLSAAMQKLGARNRKEVARLAEQKGWL